MVKTLLSFDKHIDAEGKENNIANTLNLGETVIFKSHWKSTEDIVIKALIISDQLSNIYA